MPQMAPIWWSSLFCMFILSMMMVMVLMYFFNICSPKKNIKKMWKNMEKYGWKW